MRDVTATDHPMGLQMLKTTAMRTGKGSRKDSGQGMTEYIIIVALIAISAIGVTSMFGQNIRIVLGGATAALAGETNVTVTGKTPSSAQTGVKTLTTYGKNGS